jgi:hypothetical protein
VGSAAGVSADLGTAAARTAVERTAARSIPAAMMTSVMPAATMALMESCSRMLRKLRVVKKTGEIMDTTATRMRVAANSALNRVIFSKAGGEPLSVERESNT